MKSGSSTEGQFERFTPELPDPGIRQEHFHRYVLASRFCAGKQVLDLGCGNGYGTWFLANSAAGAVGLDTSDEAVSSAKLRYAADNLAYVVGLLENLPFPEKSFDIVVCFELIEHMCESARLECLAQIKKVLKQDGALLISTPTKVLSPRTRPNFYHSGEMDLTGFMALITPHFENITILGQSSYVVSDIYPLAVGDADSEPVIEYRGVCRGGKLELFPPDANKEPQLYVALATNVPTQSIQRSRFHDSEASSAYYHAEIRKYMDMLHQAKYGIYCAGEILKYIRNPHQAKPGQAIGEEERKPICERERSGHRDLAQAGKDDRRNLKMERQGPNLAQSNTRLRGMTSQSSSKDSATLSKPVDGKTIKSEQYNLRRLRDTSLRPGMVHYNYVDRLYLKYKHRPLKLGCKLLWYSVLDKIKLSFGMLF
jgi:SAM-dependent methyltransferase